MAALETPLSPVKINAVAMRGVNDDEISDMAKLTLRYPMHVRFIELMPLNGDTDGSRFRSLFVLGARSWNGRRRARRAHADRAGRPGGPCRRVQVRRRARHLRRHNAVSEPFCARCSRLRLTADGKIHPCLLTDLDVPVKDAIRSEDPIPAIHRVLWETAAVKPAAGLTLPEESRNRTMSQIGG
jgi:cyclic pyranopterin phosphate synthase